jgi:hypothetical protein
MRTRRHVVMAGMLNTIGRDRLEADLLDNMICIVKMDFVFL